MNKLKLLVGLLIGLTFFSCSSNDENGGTETLIIGTWKLIGSSTNSVNDQLPECDLMTRVTFNSNSTADFKEHFLDGGNCIEDSYTANYSMGNNSISFTYDGETYNLTFVLTETNLTFTQIESGITYVTNWEKVE